MGESDEQREARMIVRKRRIREDFLRSISNNWSVPVSISHAGTHCKAFRDLFRDDKEIQELLATRRAASRQLMRGSRFDANGK